MIAIFLLFLFITALPVVFLGWYILDAWQTGEYFITRQGTIKKLSLVLHKSDHASGVFYDLGSGRGDFLIQLGKECPQLTTTGFDNSFMKIWISRWRAFWRRSKAVFIRIDFLKTDISAADIVYAYVPKTMLFSLQEKLKKELKLGAIAITSRVHFPDWQPREVIFGDPENLIEDIFIYERSPSAP